MLAPSKRSRRQRLRTRLEPGQWRTLAAMAAVILVLHLIGFFLLFAVIAPQQFSLGQSGIFTVGVGITAYTLGLKHAFDADHIAAIDNTTRKLMAENQRPMSVGFFFSLGHSTVVAALATLFALGVRALTGQLQNDGSWLHDVTGWIGTGISGGFLYVIAALNIVILVGILRVFRKMRKGAFDEAELERQLDSRGLMNRFFGRITNAIKKPWQMYPTGLLFGLGFDTATEVALLFLAAGAAMAQLPFYAILCLPVLFAAGMVLLDTIDGCFMNFAYGWAFSKPVRKIFYNLTITALSIFVALAVGTIEIASLVSARLNLQGEIWSMFQGVDINQLGFIIGGIFVVTWVVALVVWHFGKIEDRWNSRVQPSHDAQGGAPGSS